MGMFILVTLAAHGAVGLGQRTTGVVRLRSLKLAQRLWRVVVVMLVMISVATWCVRAELMARMVHQPIGWLGLLAVATGLIVVLVSLSREKESPALIGSFVFFSGVIVAGAAGVFPYMVQSMLDPQYSLSAYQTAADGNGLAIALVWWPIAFIFALGYFLFIFRYYSGKVVPARDTQRPY
jgi:cytochrome d ubiquinol oxidase subunit II